MSDAVKVVGARELRAQLRKAGTDVTDLKAANAAVAAYVARVAQTRAPRRTGRLAASLRGNRAAARARVSAGGAAVPYAGPIHWGWEARNIEPNPFVRETAEQTQAVWLTEYERELARIARSIKGARS